mgnify:CR=1 FL=1|jgi:hypothetical protein
MADDKHFRHLREHLVQISDLPDFIEKQGGVDLKWSRDEQEAVCSCPLPDHYETKPSFHVTNLDGVWIYHCFGCQKKGTIIHFCIDMLGHRNQTEAIKFLCDHYKIKNVDDLILQGLKNISKKVNFSHQIDNENILVSNQCRMLLKRDFKKHKKWVLQAYHDLNKALDDQDYSAIEKIGHDAFQRING